MPALTNFLVGGFVPLSTVDWPDQLAAVVFARGCPWNCPYCHNPHLIPGAPSHDDVPWDEVRSFLETRRGLLDGVVFSGGEPTAQLALAGAVEQVRDMGFAVALHTGGPDPSRLEAVLAHVSWVGLDVKAPFSQYERITGLAGSGERVRDSLRILIASGVPFEVRTTVHPDVVSVSDLQLMAHELETAGVTNWVIQPFRPTGAREQLSAARFIASDVPADIPARFASFEVR